jgi:hypothetical protein
LATVRSHPPARVWGDAAPFTLTAENTGPAELTYDARNNRMRAI